MRAIILFLCTLAVFFAAATLGFSGPAAAGTAEAGKFIEKLGNQALSTISDAKLSKDAKQARLERLFSDSVDVPWVAHFVLGRYWKQATDDQKKRYLQAYEKFLIKHYTSRFTDYTSGSFKITATREDSASESTISMQIIPGDGKSEPVQVDYRVRQGSNLKIFDVIVEGVSLITTQRSEFSSVIANKGIDHLISQLAEKSR